MKLQVAIAAAVVLSLAASASAQQSKAEKAFDKIYPYSVAAEIGSIIFDGGTRSYLKAKNYKEKNRIFRDGEGYFSAKKYYAIDGSFAAGKLALATSSRSSPISQRSISASRRARRGWRS